MNLDPEMCRARQKRLAAELEQHPFDCVILSKPESVQYFTGFRPHRLMCALLLFMPMEQRFSLRRTTNPKDTPPTNASPSWLSIFARCGRR